MPVQRSLVLAALGLTLAACSTRVPIQMSGPTIGRAEGVATTTFYTGTLQAGGCRGNYTGEVDAGPAPLFVSCDGGRQGRGVAVLEGGRFVSARVTWADGTDASFVAAPPGPQGAVVPAPPIRGAPRP